MCVSRNCITSINQYQLGSVEIEDSKLVIFFCLCTDVGPARLFTSSGRVNWLTFSSSAYTDFCGSFASVELAWAPDNSLLFMQSDIFISGTIVMQSTLVDAGFPFCVSTEIVVSPYVQSLGVLRGSQSGSANYTAMPLANGTCATLT